MTEYYLSPKTFPFVSFGIARSYGGTFDGSTPYVQAQCPDVLYNRFENPGEKSEIKTDQIGIEFMYPKRYDVAK